MTSWAIDSAVPHRCGTTRYFFLYSPPSNPQLSAIEYRINRRPGRFPRVSDNAIDWERHIENRKSAVRCKVEHPYRITVHIRHLREKLGDSMDKPRFIKTIWGVGYKIEN